MFDVLIGVVVVLWVIVLAPPLLRARAAHRRSADFSDFYSGLSNLAPQKRGQRASSGVAATAARTATAPRRPAVSKRTAMRRRRVYTWLLSTAAFGFVVGAFGAAGGWILMVLGLLGTAAYTAAIVQMQRSQARLAPVMYLPTRPQFSSQYQLRRTVNS